MKQELDTHAAELQRIADQVSAAQNDHVSRKKRDKLMATLTPALVAAAAKAKRLRALYAEQDQVIGSTTRGLEELVQIASLQAAEPATGRMCLDCGYTDGAHADICPGAQA